MAYQIIPFVNGIINLKKINSSGVAEWQLRPAVNRRPERRWFDPSLPSQISNL